MEKRQRGNKKPKGTRILKIGEDELQDASSVT